MTRRRAARLAASLAAFTLAALLALLAREAVAVPDRLAAGDMRFATGSLAPDPWRARGRLPRRVVERVLAVEDDLAFRRALQLVRRGRSLDDPSVDGWELLRLHGRAESELARIEERDGDRRRRSQAASTLGVLFVDDALTSVSQAEVFLDLALKALQRAVALDPTNDDAKFNLELLLALRERNRDADESAVRPGDAPIGAGGAGLSPPGEGY